MAAAARPPFDPRLSFEAWRVLGAGLRPSPAGEGDGAPGSWALGDWLVFGRGRYGRHYREAAIRASALDPATLRACAAVARRFAPGRRNAALSFAHHAAVVDLGDEAQDAWLAYAAAGRWSCAELRARMQGIAPPARPAARRRARRPALLRAMRPVT
jgi:hypothetical protein